MGSNGLSYSKSATGLRRRTSVSKLQVMNANANADADYGQGASGDVYRKRYSQKYLQGRSKSPVRRTITNQGVI